MTASECITGRRSIRRFTEQTVDHSLLSSVVTLASFAPSWKNTQIVRYIAIEGDLKNRMAEQCASAHQHNRNIIDSAPVLIAVTMITGRCGFERDGSFTTDRGDSWQMFDAGTASLAFCLAAHDQGLGTVIMGIFDRQKATALLELPEGRELVALIALGYADEEPVAPDRKPVSELLSYKS